MGKFFKGAGESIEVWEQCPLSMAMVLSARTPSLGSSIPPAGLQTTIARKKDNRDVSAVSKNPNLCF